ncbi:hypothetical protein [Maribacter sp. 2308TA10-17]|uniref:hypothetical protein n=1 Tax=Maribacter sp. 2308TA10-17 TaxID=3386276 RepID=UPI0039BD8121
MKKPFFIFLFAIVSFLMSSCDLDDGQNFHFLPLQIVSAELPESFTLNETYKIQVTYNQPDGCTGFAGFEVNDQDLTVRNVVVVGTRRTDQDTCIANIEEQTTSFDFIVKYSQPYTFRFWQGESESGEQQYLEIMVPVN